VIGVFTLAVFCLGVGKELDDEAMMIAGGSVIGAMVAVLFGVVLWFLCLDAYRAAVDIQRELEAAEAVTPSTGEAPDSV
jgi:hypothetical protein